MSVSALFGLFLLAAGQPAEGPPAEPNAAPVCKCAAAPADAIIFEGVPFDAQMTLDASGRNAEARQATIFRLVKKEQGEVADPVKVWHVGDPAQCGVRFDYGKRYRVIARKAGETLETDFCLMKDIEQPAAK